jgi:hypothetical protein
MSDKLQTFLARLVFLAVLGTVIWLTVRPGSFGRRIWHKIHPAPLEIPASPSVLALLDEPLEKAHRAGKTPVLRFNQENNADADRLQKDVFSQPGWKTYEEQNLMIFDYLFPAKIDANDSELLRHSQFMEAVAATADEKRRFPLIAVLSRDGMLLGARSGYQAGGAPDYMEWIEKLRLLDNSPLVPTTAPRPAKKVKEKKPVEKKEDKNKTSLVVTMPDKVEKPVTTGVTNKIPAIMVKGVTGTGNSQVVLLAIGKRNYPFGVGEKRTIAVEDSSLVLVCREITTNTVVIHVNEEAEDRTLPLP